MAGRKVGGKNRPKELIEGEKAIKDRARVANIQAKSIDIVEKITKEIEASGESHPLMRMYYMASNQFDKLGLEGSVPLDIQAKMVSELSQYMASKKGSGGDGGAPSFVIQINEWSRGDIVDVRRVGGEEVIDG